MIIGVLGKGGSGKSTVSTNLVKFLASKKEHTVLAIDADHNMDITYNLGVTEEFPYLGGSMSDLKHITGLQSDDNYREALGSNEQGLFTLSPKDSFTKKYAKQVTDNLSVMTAGPQTDDVLSDKSCSHILFTSLKVYLPLLFLKENEWVIVDEKAGADGVSTGIPTGFDLALVVIEPTVHGIKAGKQIAMLLDHFNVPYEFVVNKMAEHHSIQQLTTDLGKAPVAVISFGYSFTEFDTSNMEELVKNIVSRKESLVGKRYERSKMKFAQQSE
jgi:CO dehydrogenase nickel-insertion accessory protein CooC1